jgi:uncharacterized protein YbjT (DUF2867 family)
MTADKRTVVVCGATGRQGGAVLDSLLQSEDWNVVALTRDPNGKGAQALRERGLQVRHADLGDRASLAEAFVGAYGVYGVTTPLTPRGRLDVRMERAQGRNIAEACVANKIDHLVMSTVLCISSDQDVVPYVRSKREIEKYVIDLGIPSTFLRPASFMDEIGGEFLPVKNGVVTGQADNDAKVPYIACRDIGRVARLAFEHPAKFIGQELNLVADFITGDELAAAVSRVSNGRPVRHKAPPMWLMWIFAREWITLRKQFESWGRPPHPPAMLEAIENSRRLLPDMLSFEQYLRAIDFTTDSRKHVTGR